jgi:hypothetical protein
MTVPVRISAPQLTEISQALAEAGFSDSHVTSLAEALKSLKGQNLDDVIAAIRKLADSQVRNGILGFDGIARGSRDPGFSKRGTYDPRHARG